MNEIRNELLILMNLSKSLDNKDDVKFYFKNILERFEFEIKEKKESAERVVAECEENLKLLKAVKKEIESELNK